MSLIKCPECGKDMSDKAPSCPSCGCPIDVVIAERQRIKKEAEIKKQQEETEKAVGKKYKRQVLFLWLARRDSYSYCRVQHYQCPAEI